MGQFPIFAVLRESIRAPSRHALEPEKGRDRASGSGEQATAFPPVPLSPERLAGLAKAFRLKRWLTAAFLVGPDAALAVATAGWRQPALGYCWQPWLSACLTA